LSGSPGAKGERGEPGATVRLFLNDYIGKVISENKK
jgi:hypothetical protein